MPDENPNMFGSSPFHSDEISMACKELDLV